jgi:hypothetical protein
VRRVVVHIDRLVLRGVRREDRYAVAEGLQQELTRLLADPHVTGSLASLGSVQRLRAGGVDVAPGSGPQRLGERVAHGISRGLTK